MNKLKEYKMYIDGSWIESESKKTFETLNPENNEPWAKVPEASSKDVDKAVRAAQKAFEGEWPKLFPRERAKYLRAIANQLRENADHLGKIETIDTGKLYKETKPIIIPKPFNTLLRFILGRCLDEKKKETQAKKDDTNA